MIEIIMVLILLKLVILSLYLPTILVEAEEEMPAITFMPDITVANVLAELQKDEDNNTSLLATMLDNLKYLISPGLVSNNTKCRSDSERYWNEVTKGYDGQLWAMKMVDSDGSLPPFAYFFKNDENLGKFEECIHSESDDLSEEERVTGKYCTYQYNIHREILDEKFSSNKRLKRAAEFFSKAIESYNPTTFRGLCVPSSCSPSDIMEGVSLYLNPMGITADVSEYDCAVKNEFEYSPGVIIMIILLCALGGLILWATLYDMYYRNEGAEEKQKTKGPQQNDFLHSLVPCFSIQSNIEKMMTIKSNDLDFLNGLRGLARVWVTVGYGHSMLMKSMQRNAENVYMEVYKWHVNVCLACKLGVDTFFFLSTFLTSYVFLLTLKGDYSRWNVTKTALMSYIHRYLRLFPSYAAMIAMYTTFFYHMGDGPIWKNHVKHNVENCQESWWTNLLFINALTDSPSFSRCIQPSWFLSLDLIYWFLSPPLLALLLYRPLVGVASLVTIFLSSAMSSIFYRYINAMPTFIFSIVPIADISGTFLTIFRKSSPALAGLFCGYLCFKQPKPRLSKNMVSNLWWTTGVLSPVLLFGGFQVLQLQNADVNKVYDAFTILSRPAWCMVLTWIVFACSQGYGRHLKRFLSWAPFHPMSKMMFSMFLVSYPVQVWLFYSKKKIPFYDDTLMNFTCITQVMLLIIYGFFFYILVECPLTGLARIVFERFTNTIPKIKTG